LFIVLGQFSGLLREEDPKSQRHYILPLPAFSWSKVQLAFWTWIILSSFAGITLAYQQIPYIDVSTLVLLGMSATVFTLANALNIYRDQGLNVYGTSRSFMWDILADGNGVSIARLQNLLFNLIFGIWYVADVFRNLNIPPGGGENAVLPHLTADDLVLLGISSAGFAAMKILGSKPGAANPVINASAPSSPPSPAEPPPLQNEKGPTLNVNLPISLFLAGLAGIVIGGTATEMPKYNGKENIPIEHRHYKTYYNMQNHEPDSVSWDLSAEMFDCGDKPPRKGRFRMDPDIVDTYRLEDNYIKKGYDKGHLFSFEDASCDSTDRQECFYMSNVLPQPHSLNAGRWEALENSCRDSARIKPVHIIAGGSGVSARSARERLIFLNTATKPCCVTVNTIAGYSTIQKRKRQAAQIWIPSRSVRTVYTG